MVTPLHGAESYVPDPPAEALLDKLGYSRERCRLMGMMPSSPRPINGESATVGIVERLRAEDVAGEEWAAWYALSPAERFRESAKLWETYLALGGSLEPEPDTQSPFFDPEEWRESAAHGRPGVRILRRSGI